MALADERAAYVALALTPGVGAARMERLLRHCGSAIGALEAPIAFLCTAAGLSRAAATAVKEADPNSASSLLQRVTDMGGFCLFPDDPGFPPALRQIPDPPLLLFAQGSLGCLAPPAVAMVGSRDHSPYGTRLAARLAAGAAAAGLAVVSGMARGLDALVHRAALEAGGATVGILGNGLGVVYPAANRELYGRVAEAGLLLSEFPPGERPGVGAFPRRNRLISGLARVTVVLEAAQGSGTLITVSTALAQGRDVMAVPGEITSPTSVGTNRLIRDGAEPLLGLEDLLHHYPELRPVPAPTAGTAGPPPAPVAVLSPAERRLVEALAGGAAVLDDLVARSGLPAGETLAALSSLELRGLVRHQAGVVDLQHGAVPSHSG